MDGRVQGLGTLARRNIGTGTRDYPDILTPLLRGQLQGLGMSNDAAGVTTHVNIAAGACRDSTNVATLQVSDLTKRIDQTWAANDDAGGLNDTDHPVVQDTCYHVHLLGKPDGTTEAGFDTSVTAANLLNDAAAGVGGAGYTLYRRIGSVITLDAAATVIPFIQHGDTFMLSDPSAADHAPDFSAADVGTTVQTATLSVPSGIRVEAIINVYADDNGQYRIYPADMTEVAAILTDAPLTTLHGSGSIGSAAARIRMLTNTSAQVKISGDSGNAQTVLMFSEGWIDARGKYD